MDSPSPPHARTAPAGSRASADHPLAANLSGETSTAGAGLVRFCVAAAIGGALTGLVGGAFRLVLERADEARDIFVAWAHQWPLFGWVFPVIAAAICAALARWIVRWAPAASGSGVQHVEAVMRGEAEPAPLRVLPAKFVGGALAIGSGLALGREGPTVQMGATIGISIARVLRATVDDLRAMQAATAGAGLAVAFNAPVGGALFVFEEVGRSVGLRLTLATLIACAAAVGVARVMLGDRPDFTVVSLASPSFVGLLPHLVLGAFLGALGAAYSRATLWGLNVFDRITMIPVELRAALVGGVVGLVAWFEPSLVGGGDRLNQEVLGAQVPLFTLVVIFVVRWFIGPWSYAAGTPGGLFAPLLLVGSAFGIVYGHIAQDLLPALAPQPLAFALVGMCAFFTAVVRAPLTGIVLITEMTATTTLLVPMLAACFAAMLVATVMGSEPIYDTLRARMLQTRSAAAKGSP
jgi:CIC family chloride channel protein